MPVARAEAAKGVRAGAATGLRCRRLETCATRSKEGGGRGRPQVENLRLRGARKEAVGGARRLPTCGYEEQGRRR